MAVTLPVLVMLAVAGMAAVGVVAAQLRCVDSARAVARAMARGEPVAVAQRLGASAAPVGATITISRQGDQIVVTVSALTHSVTRLAPAIAVSARAVGELEPGADDPIGR